MAQLPVTLVVGQTTTPEIDIDEHEVVVGFHIDANLTGTSFSFTEAPTFGGTFYAVEDGASVAVTLTVAASTVAKPTTTTQIAAISPMKHFKIVTTEQATSDSVITVLTQKIK